ncbi:AAEL008926-PA, partial [Aedes aegypti]
AKVIRRENYTVQCRRISQKENSGTKDNIILWRLRVHVYVCACVRESASGKTRRASARKHVPVRG